MKNGLERNRKYIHIGMPRRVISTHEVVGKKECSIRGVGMLRSQHERAEFGGRPE